MYHQYPHYPQDQGQHTSAYPPSFSQASFSQSAPLPQLSLPQSAAPHTALPQVSLQSPVPSPSLDSTRLMELLTHSTGAMTIPSSNELSSSALNNSDASYELSQPPTAVAPAVPSAPPVSLAPTSGSGRLTSRKLPKGRKLKGEHVVYDIDARLRGEAQPQLEVSPITVYGSDPVLVLGRQIAVNRSYICYGLRPNRGIRILNINTALRYLLRGHLQRVTDMAFFAEDVHLLASASSDGRVFVRRIVEGPGEDNKMQITDEILLAIQFTGGWESAHPRICWHSHTQDILVVGVNKYILTIDIPKVRMTAAPNGFLTDEPVNCPIDNPIEGVHCVVGHEGEVTDLSTSQWTRLASASKDGTIRIWKDENLLSISTFTPYEGQQVGAVAFLSAPHRPDHIVLLSAGPLNRELKLWVPAVGEGWFPPSGAVKWKCTQTLEFKSSAGGKNEDAFFNQVLVVPRASTILLANARKNAIYVVHVDFGSNPSATRFDYLAEFSVTMPILSLTATSENVLDGDGIVQVYCVQTQAIQQYSLELSQCFPPVGEAPALSLEKDLMFGCQVSDGSVGNSTGTTEASTTAFEVSAILRAKSPGPISGVSLTDKPLGVAKPALFGSPDDSPSSRGQSPPISIDSAVGISTRELVPNISRIAAPVPQVGPVPLSPRGSPRSPLARLRPKSPVDNRLVNFVSSPREQADYFQDSFPLSPTRMGDENVRMNDEKEWQVTSTAGTSSVISDQQISGGSMHLITPSELMSMVARAKAEVDGGIQISSPRAGGISKEYNRGESTSDDWMENMELEGSKVETKEVTDSSVLHPEDSGTEKDTILKSSVFVSGSKEKAQICAVSEYSSADNGKEGDVMEQIISEQALGDESQQGDESEALEEKDRLLNVPVDETQEQLREVAVNTDDSPSLPLVSQARKKKNKNKTDAGGLNASTMVATSAVQTANVPALMMNTTAAESSNGNSSISSSVLAAQIVAMQDSLNQLLGMQRELQKQMPVMVAIPVAKEIKRMEAALGQRMEKVLKAHVDAMWARLQEDNAKREKLERDRVQQLTSMLSNSINKDLPAALERTLKKEMSLIGPSVARLVTPNIEKAISVTVNECFQKGINEKAVAQLEKSVGARIEALLSKQLQAQFQTNGKQALQEALRSCLEGSVIPAFERACQAMFGQVDTAFQKGLSEHRTQAQQLAASQSALASTLQDTVASASFLAASLKGELADGQRKLIALAESTGNSRGAFMIKPSNGALPDKVMTVQHVEESLDPTKELARLISERKLEEAFNKALSLTDVGVLSWLCNQVDPAALFTITPPPLSQGVLLLLVQQLGCDLGNDTYRKLTWIREAALALNPHDPGLAPHMRLFLEKLYQNLHRLMASSILSPDVESATRLVIHVVNSLLTACK